MTPALVCGIEDCTRPAEWQVGVEVGSAVFWMGAFVCDPHTPDVSLDEVLTEPFMQHHDAHRTSHGAAPLDWSAARLKFFAEPEWRGWVA